MPHGITLLSAGCISRDATRHGRIAISVLVGSSTPRTTALYQPSIAAGSAPIQIRYRLAEARMVVRLSICDARGREIWSSEQSVRDAGEQTETWDCRNRSGTRLPRGVYFVRLDAGGVTDSKKFALLHR
jgi:hypothetical protein